MTHDCLIEAFWVRAPGQFFGFYTPPGDVHRYLCCGKCFSLWRTKIDSDVSLGRSRFSREGSPEFPTEAAVDVRLAMITFAFKGSS